MTAWPSYALALALVLAWPGAALDVDAMSHGQARAGGATGQAGSATCAEAEGPRIDAPLGIAVCQGTVRVAVRAAAEPQAGVRVIAVVASGPAAKAGLAANDVIYMVNGVRVESGTDAIARLARGADAKASNRLRLQINFWRDGLPFIVRIPLESR